MTRLAKNIKYLENSEWTLDQSRDDLKAGIALLSKIDKPLITFFGGGKTPPESPDYHSAYQLAFELGKAGYAVGTGGGPGVMRAANEGAMKAQAPSIGFKEQLYERNRPSHPNFTLEHEFYFLFVRRFIMAIKCEALVFFPGGLGTLNELFEYAMLMQTNVVDKVPLILYNEPYWKEMMDWLERKPFAGKLLNNGQADLNLFHSANSPKDVLRIISEG